MSMSRREFLKTNTAAALGVATGGAFLPEFRFPRIGPDVSRRTDEPVRIAVLGTGNRGQGLLEVLLGFKGVEFPALCDIQAANLELAREMVVKAGRKKPEGYGRDETDYKRLLERSDIDAVIIASYWEWHTPIGPYQELYKHAWWRAIRSEAGKFSHGGTDYLELRLFVEAVRNKTQTPLDVYDAALMSANRPLSEESIAKGGAPIPYPDFTGGRWQTTKPRFAVE